MSDQRQNFFNQSFDIDDDDEWEWRKDQWRKDQHRKDKKASPGGNGKHTSGHHSTADGTKAAALFPILTVTQLADLPDPEWLIDDLMVASSLCTLYGQFRSYKSFIALDWGLCLATGTDWCDRTVKQCDVLYIAGEGVGGSSCGSPSGCNTTASPIRSPAFG